MSDDWAPYKPPRLRRRGWRVGPTEAPLHPEFKHPTFAAVGVIHPKGAVAATVKHTTAAISGKVSPRGTINATKLAARFAGTGIIPTSYTDSFDRADSDTTLGTGWTNRNGVMGISTNCGYPVTADTNCVASYDSALSANDMSVSITVEGYVGSGGDRVIVVLGAATSGEMALLFIINGFNGYIYSSTGWDFGVNGTVQATSSSNVTYTTGDVILLQRVGNVYTAKLNGSTITGLTWTDSGDVLTRNASHRLTGVGSYNNSGTGYRRINSWAAQAL